jgi:hypothetical protein
MSLPTFAKDFLDEVRIIRSPGPFAKRWALLCKRAEEYLAQNRAVQRRGQND